MKKLLLLLMIASLGLVSCTKEETITPQSTTPTPIDFSSILKSGTWTYVLIEDWLFLDTKIQSKTTIGTPQFKNYDYKLFTDSIVVFFRNPQTNVIEPASYANLQLVNDTIYYKNWYQSKKWFLVKKK